VETRYKSSAKNVRLHGFRSISCLFEELSPGSPRRGFPAFDQAGGKLHGDTAYSLPVLFHHEKAGFTIDEVEVFPKSPIANTLLKDSPIRCDLGILVVGIKKKEKEMVFNPAPDTRIEAGDILIVIGENKKLEEMGKMTHPA